jgi:hydroxymethylbilane synthase
MTALRLGTRRSALARAQSEGVAATLRAAGHTVELVDVTTEGDVSTASLRQIGGTGVFVSALRDALLAGDVDLAVHSLKDLPTAEAPGIRLAAVPVREDPSDVLVARADATLATLPSGARVGTGSPRRAVQVRAARPDLEIVDLRGNVDTRLRRVADGDLDAVLLARAGLARIGRLDAVSETLDVTVVTPAPGQGALAIETRDDRLDVAVALDPLDDPETRVAVTAERSLLAALEAGCSAPVGALATLDLSAPGGAELFLRAAVGAGNAPDGVRRTSTTGPSDDAAGIGRRLARQILAEGADGLLGATAS